MPRSKFSQREKKSFHIFTDEPAQSKPPGLTLEQLWDRFFESRRSHTGSAEAAASIKTIMAYEWVLDPYFKYLEQRNRKHWNEVTTADTQAYLQPIIDSDSREGGLAKATKLNIYRHLRAFLRFIDEDEECQRQQMEGHRNIVPKVPQHYRDEHEEILIPTQDEVVRFLKQMEGDTDINVVRDRMIAMLILDNGMRHGELCWLKLQSLERMSENLINIGAGKRGRRTVPIHTDRIKQMKHYLERRKRWLEQNNIEDHGFLFYSSEDGSPLLTQINGKVTANYTCLNQAFAKYRKQARIPHTMSPHMLRHFFATQALANGMGETELQRIMGHIDKRTLEIYLHMGQRQKQVIEQHAKFSPSRVIDLALGHGPKRGAKKKKVFSFA